VGGDVLKGHVKKIGRERECFYLHVASLLTDQSRSTSHDPWQGQGNLIVMQP
jgi:hypothetical protein